MDLTYLKELGPFLKALSSITIWSEKSKKGDDKITPGKVINPNLSDNLGGSFILWRGAAMKDAWVDPYCNQVGQQINLPGSNSCSKSPIVALQFTFPLEKVKKRCLDDELVKDKLLCNLLFLFRMCYIYIYFTQAIDDQDPN